MTEVNTKEVEIKEKTGTWSQSKKLLVDCDSKHNYGYDMRFSKNLKNIYKIMIWMEENNRIKNHVIEKNTKICVPKEVDDYIIIIASEIPLVINSKYTKENFEIEYGDIIVFQHNRQPKIDSKVSETIVSDCLSKNIFYDEKKIIWAPTAEDVKSGDMNVEEIVEKNPSLKDRFHDVLYFKNIIKTETKRLENFKISINDSKVISNVQGRIEFILEEIVECAKQEMESLMKLCSISEWQILAMKMYDRFCSDDDSDYKDDLLNKLFTGHDKTKTCIENFRKRFEEYIKKYNYDIISFDIADFHDSVYGNNGQEGIGRPIFGDFLNFKKLILKFRKSELKKIPEYIEVIKGPAICFHDIQGFNVRAKDIKIKNGFFSCNLCFDFYDHFGLDSKDIDKFGNKNLVGKGFQSWYLLQHLSEYETGCKAFVNHAIHEEMVELKIEE